ncbi:MAG TPA: GlsB/YeaQ/YmgE family stress response membrane protein [Actinomycetota bacterium]|nr:GlsB/YeaQ/YmgE family stress response membrane protein [Actinomycetota bacterium]
MEILWYIVVGAIVGLIARLLLPGRDPIGIIGTILLGIVGAIVGGLVWQALFEKQVGWIGSILAAMLLLFIYRKMTYGRRTV